MNDILNATKGLTWETNAIKFSLVSMIVIFLLFVLFIVVLHRKS